jgi:hypothetical protein
MQALTSVQHTNIGLLRWSSCVSLHNDLPSTKQNFYVGKGSSHRKGIVLVTRRHPTTRDSIRVEELKEYGTRLLHVFGPANEGDLHTIV